MLIAEDVEAPELEPIDDGNSDFEKVELRGPTNGKMHPHCTQHGAMNKVASWENNEGMWRCLRSENTEDCRAGAIERRDTSQELVKRRCEDCGPDHYTPECGRCGGYMEELDGDTE